MSLLVCIYSAEIVFSTQRPKTWYRYTLTRKGAILWAEGFVTLLMTILFALKTPDILADSVMHKILEVSRSELSLCFVTATFDVTTPQDVKNWPTSARSPERGKTDFPSRVSWKPGRLKWGNQSPKRGDRPVTWLGLPSSTIRLWPTPVFLRKDQLITVCPSPFSRELEETTVCSPLGIPSFNFAPLTLPPSPTNSLTTSPARAFQRCNGWHLVGFPWVSTL